MPAAEIHCRNPELPSKGFPVQSLLRASITPDDGTKDMSISAVQHASGEGLAVGHGEKRPESRPKLRRDKFRGHIPVSRHYLLRSIRAMFDQKTRGDTVCIQCARNLVSCWCLSESLPAGTRT